MYPTDNSHINTLLLHYPELEGCRKEIQEAAAMLCSCFRKGGKLLLCGNGGSAADCEHIVGELMKGFLLRRPVPEKIACNPELLAEAPLLQQGLPAISLTGQPALSTAIQNDIGAQMVFAQQVYGYGRPEDVLLGISTSGNSENIMHAMHVAKALGLHTIGLTGRDGGNLAKICEIAICVPAVETYRVQEYHLPIYHAICAMVEEAFFGE